MTLTVKKRQSFSRPQSSTTASKIQDFKLSRYCNIIIVPKTNIKHLQKSIITLADFLKHYYWNSFTSKEKQTSLRGRLIIELIYYLFFYWMRMVAAIKAKDILARFCACSWLRNRRRQNFANAVALQIQKRLMTEYTCFWVPF